MASAIEPRSPFAAAQSWSRALGCDPASFGPASFAGAVEVGAVVGCALGAGVSSVVDEPLHAARKSNTSARCMIEIKHGSDRRESTTREPPSGDLGCGLAFEGQETCFWGPSVGLGVDFDLGINARKR